MNDDMIRNLNARVTYVRCNSLHIGTGQKCMTYCFWSEGRQWLKAIWHVRSLSMMEVTKWKSS